MVYTLTPNPRIVIRDADSANMPDSNAEYQAWKNAGNTPNPVPPPSKAKQAADWLAGGLTVNFTSGAAVLSGRYACIPPHNHNINAIATSQAYDSSALPGGLTTVMISTMDGQVMTFAKSEFKLLMRAIRDFVYGCQLYVMGQAATLPDNVTSKSIQELDEAAPQ